MNFNLKTIVSKDTRKKKENSGNLTGTIFIKSRKGRESRYNYSGWNTRRRILKDINIDTLSAAESLDLLDILDGSTSLHSTCLASQLPIEVWYQHFTDATLADAILDRLIHKPQKIILKGDFMRKLTSSSGKEQQSSS